MRKHSVVGFYIAFLRVPQERQAEETFMFSLIGKCFVVGFYRKYFPQRDMTNNYVGF